MNLNNLSKITLSFILIYRRNWLFEWKSQL